MTPDVVVDIGNSRMKWGLVRGGRVADVAILNLDNTEAWIEQSVKWELGKQTAWVIASVNPAITNAFVNWLGEEANGISLLETHLAIPLVLDVESPGSVGMDRLLACFAAKAYADPGAPFLVVQAGTALVINRVDADGAFAGGAILPGLTLMAKSLRLHTAQLPEVIILDPVKPEPGRTTEAAVRTGIFWASIGAILTLRAGFGGVELPIFITGGDGHVLFDQIPAPVTLLPDLVLEGIRLAAEARP